MNWLVFSDGSHYDMARDSNNVGVPTGSYGDDWIVVACDDATSARTFARSWQRGEPTHINSFVVREYEARRMFVDHDGRPL